MTTNDQSSGGNNGTGDSDGGDGIVVDLARIISLVQITGIRLRETSCRSVVHPSRVAETIRAKTASKTAVLKDPTDDGLLLIDVTLEMKVCSNDEAEVLQAEIRGAFELTYSVPTDENFSGDELRGFAQVNAVFNAWPYWRELVQASLARMSLPTLTVPVFRLWQGDTAGILAPDAT